MNAPHTPSLSSHTSEATPARTQARALNALLPFLAPYRWVIMGAGVFLVLAALSMLLMPIALKALIDQGLVANDPGERIMAMREHFLALFAVGAALGLTSAGRFYLVTWLGERITADLRSAVYRHVMKQSPAFFEHTQTGEVLSRLSADTAVVQSVVGSSLSMGLRNAVMGLGALTMLVVTNPWVMAQVLGILVCVVLPALWWGRRVKGLARASQDRAADASALAAEALGAVTVVQSFSQAMRESDRYASANEQAFHTSLKRVRVRSGLVAFMITATFGALLWGLYLGTQAVLRGEMSAGHLSQTVVYVMLLVGSVGVLAEVWSDVLRAAGATERLMELLQTRSQLPQPDSPTAPAHTPGQGVPVEFKHVHFHYPTRPGQAALHDFNLSIRAGETVALVGPSGAGKSTVLQLLLRFYEAGQGNILVGGLNIRSLRLDELRQRMAIVPQDSTVFSGSVLDNIRYGRPSATEAEVQKAAQLAHAHDFIERLPQAYHTPLGERGVRLSGGQRQRLCIARALLMDPPLLLLDEATSALDTESERAVQAALDAASQGRTTLIVAHRLSTVQRADRIVVMDAGEVVEEGTHQSLLAQGGLYARLAAWQLVDDAPRHDDSRVTFQARLND